MLFEGIPVFTNGISKLLKDGMIIETETIPWYV